MTEARTDDYASWIGRKAVDRGAHKIGRIEDIYADDESGQPEWLAVHTGWFGNHVSFVPLRGSRVAGDELMVAYDKDVVKDAPRATADGHLSVAEEDRLYQYYGMGDADWSTTRNDRAERATAGAPYDTTTGLGGRADLANDASRGAERYDTAGDTTATAGTTATTGEGIRDEGRARLRRWNAHRSAGPRA